MTLSRIADLLATREEKVVQWTLQLTKWVLALTISGWLVWSQWGWQDKAIVGAIGVLLLSNLVLLTKYLSWKAKEQTVQKRLKAEREKGPQPIYLDRLTESVLRTLARNPFGMSLGEISQALENEEEQPYVDRSLEILTAYNLIERYGGDRFRFGQLLSLQQKPPLNRKSTTPNKTMEETA